MNVSLQPVPDWDLEQLEVIMEPSAAWQLVVAGPGSGKSAVACQRVAYLIDEGVAPSRILLVSFTRTAVAELRDRIVSYAVDSDAARIVRISTIDSHAWSLRVGFDDLPFEILSSDGSYDLSIERVIELFRIRQPDLLDFVQRLEHLIVDEAQDIVGLRAELVVELLRALSSSCGVTILADPAQAIYGFTTDEDDDDGEVDSLLDMLNGSSPRPLTMRRLTRIHRVHTPKLIDVFQRTRAEIENPGTHPGHVERVRSTIRDLSDSDLGEPMYEGLVAYLSNLSSGSTLVLFRHRFEVLMASSYCSSSGMDHRLRLSGTPSVVVPWIGWVFGQATDAIISQPDFDSLWDKRAAEASEPFQGLSRDASWSVLHRLAASRRAGTLDLAQLRQLIARTRPPVEICSPDYGTSGPILGTIHASKGREADNVVLVLPASSAAEYEGTIPPRVLEEGRVYYVGATRARKMLAIAANPSRPVSYLPSSGRIFRRLPKNKVQLEIGRSGDVDRLAHLAWSNAAVVQLALATSCGISLPLQARIAAELDYAIRLVLEQKGADGVNRYMDVGEMSVTFRKELNRVWGIIDSKRALKPPSSIHHLHLIGVTTIALSDEEKASVAEPYNRSGLALSPVIKGFSTIPFLFRKRRGNGG